MTQQPKQEQPKVYNSIEQENIQVNSQKAIDLIESIQDPKAKEQARSMREDLIRNGSGNDLLKLRQDRSVESVLSELIRKKIAEGRFEKYKKQSNPDIQKIIGEKNISNMTTSQMLFLGRRKADLASLLLVNESSNAKEIKSSEIQANDSFIVNFGDNRDFDAAIGAGDILPYSVNKISVNGKEGIRKTLPRPGFYTVEGNYLPIYNGYKIKILEVKTLKKEEQDQFDSAEKKHFEDRRIDDLIENECTSTDLPEDQELLSRASEEMKRRDEIRKKYGAYLERKSFARQDFLANFGDIVSEETNKYGIDPELLLRLIDKESRFNPNNKNKRSTAYGFGQIITGTWRFITNNILRKPLDRKNPEDQIRATCAYLNWIKVSKNCSWGDAVVYYHTGPDFGEQDVAKSWVANKEALLPFLGNTPESAITVDDYKRMARKYYGVDDFSNTGGTITGPILAKAKEILPQGDTVYIGDSIAVGLGGNKWSCAAEGKTTDYILKQVTSLQASALNRKTVVVHCGTNDMVNSGISVENSIRNIEEITRICREKGAVNVKVCTLSAFSDSSRIGYNNRVTDFNAQLSKISTKNDIKLVPVDAIVRNSEDGVHYAANNLQTIRNTALEA